METLIEEPKEGDAQLFGQVGVLKMLHRYEHRSVNDRQSDRFMNTKFLKRKREKFTNIALREQGRTFSS